MRYTASLPVKLLAKDCDWKFKSQCKGGISKLFKNTAELFVWANLFALHTRHMMPETACE